MSSLKVRLKKNSDDSYEIIVREGIFKEVSKFLALKNYAGSYAVISDTHVSRLYGNELVSILKKSGIHADLITFPAGEKHKNLLTVEKVLQKMLEAGYDRSSGVIALGGGVTGDLAGFVASVFMRGISLIHIPTTLLAMVDSSIGGKTGIDLQKGKNLAGTFYQPKLVLIDPTFLATLPKKEIENGMGEVIKYGVLGDEELLEFAEQNRDNVLEKNFEFMQKVIVKCCRMKADIVSEDEREQGRRAILNYGHTIGHAIEKLSRYTINHGQAIAMGMILINAMAMEKGVLHKDLNDRICYVLKEYRLLSRLENLLNTTKIVEKLWAIMQHDKKNKNGKVRFVIARNIGDIFVSDIFDKQLFARVIKKNEHFFMTLG